MKKILKALSAHLWMYQDRIVKRTDIQVREFDCTYGWHTTTATIETVDFEALCNEIDAFAEEFKE